MTQCYSIGSNINQCILVGDVDGDGVNDYIVERQDSNSRSSYTEILFGIQDLPGVLNNRRLTSVTRGGYTFQIGQKLTYKDNILKTPAIECVVIGFKVTPAGDGGHRAVLRVLLQQANPPPKGKINPTLSIDINDLISI